MTKNVFKVTVAGRSFDLHLGEPGSISINGRAIEYDLTSVETGTYCLILDGRVYILHRNNGVTSETGSQGSTSRSDGSGRELQLSIQGREYTVTVDDARSLLIRSYLSKGHAASAPVAVRAPMPGLIVRVEVEAGQLIRVGQGLVVLEAMKMENEIKALSAGKVADVHVTPGKAVEKGELLISLTQD
jgi:biotin carboxyl carrier protein